MPRSIYAAAIVCVLATAPCTVAGADSTIFGPGGVGPSRSLCFSFEELGNPGDIVVVNLTPLNAGAPGSGQLVSSGRVPGVASNVNFAPGTVDPNVAATAIGTDGNVCYLNSPHTTVDLVADHLVTIQAAVVIPTTTGAPERRVDTRSGLGGPTIAAGERRCFPVTGNPGDVALVNLTPVNAQGAGSGQLLSSDTSVNPTASNVNFAPGTVDPNVAATAIGTDGNVCYLNSPHTTVDLVADHLLTLEQGSIGYEPGARVDTRVTGPVTAARCSASDRCIAAVESPSRHTYGFLLSADGGRTWRHSTSVFFDEPLTSVRAGLSAYGIWCNQDDTECRADSVERFLSPHAGWIRASWYSGDGGETWRREFFQYGGQPALR